VIKPYTGIEISPLIPEQLAAYTLTVPLEKPAATFTVTDVVPCPLASVKPVPVIVHTYDVAFNDGGIEYVTVVGPQTLIVGPDGVAGNAGRPVMTATGKHDCALVPHALLAATQIKPPA
jgi:hypothetical protein